MRVAPSLRLGSVLAHALSASSMRLSLPDAYSMLRAGVGTNHLETSHQFLLLQHRRGPPSRILLQAVLEQEVSMLVHLGLSKALNEALSVVLAE